MSCLQRSTQNSRFFTVLQYVSQKTQFSNQKLSIAKQSLSFQGQNPIIQKNLYAAELKGRKAAVSATKSRHLSQDCGVTLNELYKVQPSNAAIKSSSNLSASRMIMHLQRCFHADGWTLKESSLVSLHSLFISKITFKMQGSLSIIKAKLLKTSKRAVISHCLFQQRGLCSLQT